MDSLKPHPATLQVDAGPRDPRLLTSVPALDGVRGMAILTVVLFHSALLMPSLRRFARDGGLGVDAFFVLSGFLITALLLREQALSGRVRLGGFYRRRALRLIPALVVLLAAQVIFAIWTDIPGAAERESVTSVLFYYSNTWLHGLPMSQGLSGLWSLAVEEQFYMVWPLVVILFLGLRRRVSTVALVTTALIAAVCVHRAMLFHDGEPTLFLYTRTITRADSLLVGALLAQLWVRRKVPTRGVTLVAWPALTFYLYAVVHGVSDDFLYRGGYTLIAIAVGCILLAVLESSWKVNDVLRLRPLRALGRVSYALYIWHLLIFATVVRVGRDWNWSHGTRLAVGLGLCAIVCSASWVFVERPFLRWKTQLESTSERGREPVLPATAIIVVSVAAVVGVAGLWASSSTKAAQPSPPPPTTVPLTNEIVVVPEIKGENAYAAFAALSKARLNFRATSRSSPSPQGEVVAQAPPAGTKVRGGTTVTVIISTGPKP